MKDECCFYVRVFDVWKSDYGDFRAIAEIGNDNKMIGNIVVSYSENTIRKLTGNLKNSLNDNELKNAFAVLITASYDNYINMPKISNCSSLLKRIYNEVFESESTMCYITEEEWKEDYFVYNDKDIELLKSEIKKYKLDDIITFNDGEYKILGYSDLELKFINDLNIYKNNHIEWETITPIDKLNNTDCFTVARVFDNNYKVELHYNEGNANIEYRTKISSKNFKNFIDEAKWFSRELKDYDVLFMLDSLFKKEYVNKKNNDYYR